MMEKLNAENFEERINAENVTLVDFYADWCGPCKMMAPVLQELAEQFAGSAAVVQVNVDEEPELAAKFKIFSIPTFILFTKGTEAERMIGAVGKNAIAEKIQSYL
ncbi:MAG: thioredoxin [Candidatus Ratteibacteria bacterium]|jgi:thioredoxin 1